MTTRAEWMKIKENPPVKHSGHFKLSHNPTALIIKEIQKKLCKTA